jgi:hypothetical protein
MARNAQRFRFCGRALPLSSLRPQSLVDNRTVGREEVYRLKVVSQVSGYGLFVPFQSDAWHIRNLQLAILDLIGLLQDRVCPILPLEPVRRFGHPRSPRRLINLVTQSPA